MQRIYPDTFRFTGSMLTPAPIDSGYEGRPKSEFTYLDYPIRPVETSELVRMILENRKCIVCLELTHNACRVCEVDKHRLCRGCSEKYVKENSTGKCPLGCELKATQPLRQMDEDLEYLRIRCPYHVNCNDELTIGDIRTHINAPPVRSSVTCSENKEIQNLLNLPFYWEEMGVDPVAGKQIKDHRPTTHLARCPYRPIVCRGCQKAVPEKIYREKHKGSDICPDSIRCILCDAGLIDEDYSNHFTACVEEKLKTCLEEANPSSPNYQLLWHSKRAIHIERRWIYDLAGYVMKKHKETHSLETALARKKQELFTETERNSKESKTMKDRITTLTRENHDICNKYGMVQFEYAKTRLQQHSAKRQPAPAAPDTACDELLNLEANVVEYAEDKGLTALTTQTPGTHIIHLTNTNKTEHGVTLSTSHFISIENRLITTNLNIHPPRIDITMKPGFISSQPSQTPFTTIITADAFSVSSGETYRQTIIFDGKEKVISFNFSRESQGACITPGNIPQEVIFKLTQSFPTRKATLRPTSTSLRADDTPPPSASKKARRQRKYQ